MAEKQKLVSGLLLVKSVIFLAVLAGAATVANLAVGWYGQSAKAVGHTTSSDNFDIAIGQDRLKLAANTIRFETQRKQGKTERVDMYLTWPQLAGYSEENHELFDGQTNSGKVIFLQLSQSTMSRDMSGRFEAIYSHLVLGEPQDIKYGLKLYRFKPDAGYGDEVLLTAKRDGLPDYVVRCLMPTPQRPSTSGDCQRDVRLGQDLTVLYRFPVGLLNQWQALDDGLVNYLQQRIQSEKPESN
jgi:hypothetical protein